MATITRKRKSKSSTRVENAFERIEAAAALLASAAALLWVVSDMSDEIRREWRRLRGRPTRGLKRSAARPDLCDAPLVVRHGDHHTRN